MTTQIEKSHAGEFILSEADGQYSRENVTVLSGEVLVPGSPVGKVTSGGKYREHDPNHSDGSQTAVGVSINHVDASGGDMQAAIIARAAEVNGHCLVLKDVSPAPVEATVDANLLTAGIVVRR